MEHILKTKKGTSLVELIAYIALYGVVMSLLASLVFVLVTTARKVNRQAILNRGITTLYNEFLSKAISLDPDSVSPVTTSEDGNTISITLQKFWKYDDDGNKVKILPTDTEYADKVTKVTFSYTKGQKIVKIYNVTASGTEINTDVDLEYNMFITSTKDETDNDISKVFTIDEQNSRCVSVIFSGYLNYDKKNIEFKYTIPIFTIADDTTNP